MKKIKMPCVQTIVWYKVNPVYQEGKKFQPSMEYILHFVKNIDEYNRGEFGVKETWWTDTRKLRELNRVPINEYITIKPNK